MRNDFAVFILTHGRADNVATMGALKKGGYTGKWYMIIDNEDETVDQYHKNFGPEHVIMFDKQAACMIEQTRWIISMSIEQLSMPEMKHSGLQKNWD